MARNQPIRLTTHVERPKPRSTSPFTRAAVIGAGIMGAGIAAHLASCLPDNGGHNVLLLDKFPETAEKAVEKQRKGSQSTDKMQRKPWEANFLDPAFSKRIECGTTGDDIAQIADADFIQEAVFEDLAIKVEVWTNLIKNCKNGAFIVSNTSSIPYHTIYDALPQDVKDLAKKKNVTLGLVHWFNPPRFNPLVEIYLPPETDARRRKLLFDFVSKNLGKNPEPCRDNPGFIGNHYGVPVLKFALDFMIKHNMKVEDVDAVLGRNVGFYGVLKLIDMVGADISASVIKSLRERLPATHPFQTDSQDIAFIQDMIAKKRTGGKSPDEEGFYRFIDDPEKPRKKKKQVIDLETGEYRDAVKVDLESAKAGRRGLREVVEADDIGGKLAWYVLSKAIIYAAGVVQDVAQDINQLDRTMRSGFNWKRGPFQMIDAFAKDEELGIDYIIRRFKAENIPVPQLLLDMTQKAVDGKPVSQPFYREENGIRQFLGFDGNYVDIEKQDGVLDLEDVKANQDPIDGNDYASLWDLGDGVLCAELHGMANSLSPTTMDVLNSAADIIEKGEKGFKSLVIYSPKSNFAIGANLGLVSLMANLGNKENKEKIDDALYKGQMTLERLKYAKFPVISAARGMALGGGCEILLHSDRVVAHAELKPGLVEAGVGLVPAWGGQAEMLERHMEEAKTKKGMESATVKALTKISTGYVSPSAFVAKRDLYLRKDDKIVMNDDFLLAEAKAEAIAMAADYQPPKPCAGFRLGGGQTQALLRASIDSKYRQQRATWHDVIALDGIARTLSGGRTDYSKTVTRHAILAKERQVFLNSVSTHQTRGQRIRTTLNTSKPLREEPLLAQISPAALRSLIRKDYTIKPRPDGNPYIQTNAPQAAQTSAAIDYNAMKGGDVVDYLLNRIEQDRWIAPAPSENLRDIYAKATADTRVYMKSQINGLRTFAPSGTKVVLAAAFTFLAQKTQQSQKVINGNAPENDKAVHAARIENYKHYRQEIEHLRQLIG